jgi:predicted DNA-binding protein
MMKKLMVYFDEDMHEDLRELAHRKKTTMAALVRYALDKTFEDDLDQIAAERALEEAARHPEDVMTLEEYAEKRGLALPSRPNTARQARPQKVAERRGQYRGRASGKARR